MPLSRILNVAKMYFNVIREIKILSKISEFHLKSGFDYQPGYMYRDRTIVSDRMM